MKVSLVIEIVAPLVISRPMPRSAYIVASVMMNGGRPICTTPKAWNRPMKTPIASEMEIAPAIDEAKPRSCVSSQATAIEMTPATAPTERSMPPVMMTKVSPMARMAIIAPCRSRLAMLLEVQKRGRFDRQRQPHRQQQQEQRQPQQQVEPGPAATGASKRSDRSSPNHPQFEFKRRSLRSGSPRARRPCRPCVATIVPPRKTCSVSASS